MNRYGKEKHNRNSAKDETRHDNGKVNEGSRAVEHDDQGKAGTDNSDRAYRTLKDARKWTAETKDKAQQVGW